MTGTTYSIFNEVRDTEGGRCLLIFRRYLREREDEIKQRRRMEFMKECRRNKIVPTSLCFKLPGTFDHCRALKWRIQKEMIGRTIGRIRKELEVLSVDSAMRWNCLQHMVRCGDLLLRMEAYVCSEVDRWSDREEEALRRRLEWRRRRERRLSVEDSERGCGDSRGEERCELVVNLSRRELSATEKQVLSKGLNFAVTPAKVDYKELVADVEAALRGLDNGEAAWARREVAMVLKSHKRGVSNLSREERDAVGELASLEEVKILQADKGGAVVVMDKAEYDGKLRNLIESGPYEKVKSDPGPKYRRELMEILREAKESGRISFGEHCRVCPTHFQRPFVFGNPKVHKAGNPLRPIVSMVGTLFAGVSRYLADVLAPYGRDGASYVLNAADVVNGIQSIEDFTDGQLVSYDVDSLFTSIPVVESLEVIRGRLSGDPSVVERSKLQVCELIRLVEFCLTRCYFVFEGDVYIQNDGIAMGSSLSVVVANIYMFHFEEMALQEGMSRGLQVPDVWMRYIDDILARFKGDAEDVRVYLDFLNSLRPTIKFTVEEENEGMLPFLDIAIRRGPDGVKRSVFRKATHRNGYLERTSCHPKSVFRGVVGSLDRRVDQICTAGEKGKERSRIKRDLSRRGYRQSDLATVGRSRKGRERKEVPQEARYSIPYYPGVYERVSKILGGLGRKVTGRPVCRLADRLVRKHQEERVQLGVVYKISCRSCNWTYVGETGRSLEQRIKEHKRMVKNMENERSEIAAHVLETGHSMNWEAATTLEKGQAFYGKRIFKESWWTKKLSSSNKVKCVVDDSWQRLIQK